jgi:hypothetical protein
MPQHVTCGSNGMPHRDDHFSSLFPQASGAFAPYFSQAFAARSSLPFSVVASVLVLLFLVSFFSFFFRSFQDKEKKEALSNLLLHEAVFPEKTGDFRVASFGYSRGFAGGTEEGLRPCNESSLYA